MGLKRLSDTDKINYDHGGSRIKCIDNVQRMTEALLRSGYTVKVTPVFDRWPRENDLLYYDIEYIKVETNN